MIISNVKMHKPKKKYYIKKIGLASSSFLFAISICAEAAMKLDLQNYQSYVMLSGSISESEMDYAGTCAGPSYGYCRGSRPRAGNIFVYFKKGDIRYRHANYLEQTPPTCDRHYKGVGPEDVEVPAMLSHEDRLSLVNFFNNYYVTPRRLFPENLPPEAGEYTVEPGFLRLVCRDPQSGESVSVSTYIIGLEIVNPPLEVGACSLNNQSINLNYSASNLNVNGITQSTDLIISCSPGIARDYTLKLTGTNVTNGRLNFTNGVSAQVSLNGTQVQANGSGIQLNGLTTRSISVSATLTGTAATSGPSSASGILILEAQ